MSAPSLERDVPEVCGECGSTELVEDTKNGDLTCVDCGYVAAELLIDLGHEWRTFESDEKGADPNRIGGPVNPLFEGGPATTISEGPSGMNSLNMRLNKTQHRNVMGASDRYLNETFGRISQFCERSGLPSVVKDRASELFKMYYDHLTLRREGDGDAGGGGGSTEFGEGAKSTRTKARLKEDETLAVISSALFVACRNEGAPRTFNEVSALVRVAKSRVAAYVKSLELTLGEAAKISRMRGTDDFVSRFCSHLGMPQWATTAATQVAREAREMEGVHGRTYVSIAAASIFMVAQQLEAAGIVFDGGSASLSRIADVAGVRDGTVRSVYAKMKPRADELLPRAFVQRLGAGRSDEGVGGAADANGSAAAPPAKRARQ